MKRRMAAVLAGACMAAQAQEFREFSSRGLPASRGLVIRLAYPADWKPVAIDDPLALTEIRGRQGPVEGVVQVGHARVGYDVEATCKPEQARTLVRNVTAENPDARVLDVLARTHQGRPAYEIRYERNNATEFLQVRSIKICWRDRLVLVSCGAASAIKANLPQLDATCARVLDSLSIADE